MPTKKRVAKRPNVFVDAPITKKTRTGPSSKSNISKEIEVEVEVDVDDQEKQVRKDAKQQNNSSKEDEEERSDSEEKEEGSKIGSDSEEDGECSKNDEEGSKNDEEEQMEAKENEEELSREEADESEDAMERRSKFLNDMDVRPPTVEESTSVSDLDDLSIPEVIKSINIEKYGFIMPVDMHENHEGSVVNRSMLGKGFSNFRKILVKQKIVDDFRNSCFGHFLDLPESVICRFQMKLVHGLMFRRILSKKTKELWFIYNGMPVCFGLNEFALISGLKCHALPPDKDLEKDKANGEFLCRLVGKSATGDVLLKKIQTKLDKKVKVALSLVWFLHSVICAKDLNKVIEYDWLKLAFTPEVFNNYPWGRISYNITVGSLIQQVKPEKVANLFGFPWAFMVSSSVEDTIPMAERLAKFEFDNDILNYVKGARPFPGGCKWNEAKRIFTVMSIGVRHYVALEFVIEEGKILVFDCNIPATEEAIFFTHIQPVLELWPKLLNQSGRFKHLSEKLLNEDWPYERLQSLPHNATGTACGQYAISFIEHRVTLTSMEDLNDNTIEDFRMKSAVAIFDKKLVP